MIIGLAGKKRCGKDTAAKWYTANGFKRIAFADAMKRILYPTFGWEDPIYDNELKDEIDPMWGFSPRRALQLFGTEFGRKLDANLWVKLTAKYICDSPWANWVIPDVRFENEASYIRQHGVLIHVTRCDAEQEVDEHASECGVVFDKHRDFLLWNDSTIESLHKRMEVLNAEIQKAERGA